MRLLALDFLLEKKRILPETSCLTPSHAKGMPHAIVHTVRGAYASHAQQMILFTFKKIRVPVHDARVNEPLLLPSPTAYPSFSYERHLPSVHFQNPSFPLLKEPYAFIKHEESLIIACHAQHPPRVGVIGAAGRPTGSSKSRESPSARAAIRGSSRGGCVTRSAA